MINGRTLTRTHQHNANTTHRRSVVGGATLELTVAQFWSSLGAASVEVELSFHGVQLDGFLGGRRGAPGCELALGAGAAPRRVTALSPLRRQRVKAEAKLTALCIPLRPAEASLEPLEAPAAAAGAAAAGAAPGGAGGATAAAAAAAQEVDGCPPRDTLPPGHVVYRLLLTYKFTATEAGKYKPTVPALNE